ncbi:phage tail protein [Schlegelella sp. S2-27]|uniref:Phage tail protein n=1 Tax=Caldimonas mangrovi TaxID=2944811 RepID=A0ABT0YQ92_9BURK|nr:phage tail protein [Caldimonas mangrovi]MCM5680494.1 phage tail protein [Caldimonas mangrovi]
MNDATRHFLLRDRRRWHGLRSGLDVDRDGALQLAALPAPADGRSVSIATPLPAAREVSGIAAGPNGAVFVSDTEHHRLLFIDGACNARAWLPPGGTAGSAPGQFHAPRGLALAAGALLVADSGNARVQHLALPALEPHLAWARWGQPVGVAVDSTGRVVVADAAGQRVERCDDRGVPDAVFNAALAAAGLLVQPRWVAIGRDDRVLVGDAGANAVFVFDADGTPRDPLPGPAGWLPGALAADDQRIYVADAATARLQAFDADGAWIGVLPHWSGPVTALALRAGGHLLVKPGLDATYHEFAAGLAHVAQGHIAAGPLDAAELADWERVWCESSTPEGTRCTLEYAHQANEAPAPVAWTLATSNDALLSAGPPAAPGTRRHLWLRVTLSTTVPARTPRLTQARAATPGEDYLDHLPMTYRLHDAAPDGREGFLSRWLKLLRGEFTIIEEALDLMPRLPDPQHAPGTHLAWLASWLALELPRIRDDDECRELIARAVRLHARRGTPASIAEHVALHTGIRPTIVEAYEGRHLWLLGTSSRLGFDTQLPPFDPLGWVVPDPDAAIDCCAALEAPAGCGMPVPLADAGCGPCVPAGAAGPVVELPATTVGRAIVGEGGPLAAHQIGLPLFSDEAYRFCVLVDAYRVCDAALLDEIRRIVDREKPAHTDWRLELVEPDMRVGLQARIGIDAIVGGERPGWRLGAELGTHTTLSPRDAATRLDGLVLGDGMTLN